MEYPKNIRVQMVLKAFLSQVPSEKKKKFVHFLPLRQQEEMHSLPSLKLEWGDDKDILEKVHWSWFLPTLKTYPETEQKLFLSALDPYAAKNLARTLTLSLNGQQITQIGKAFLRKTLLDSLIEPEGGLLPLECLAPSSILELLKLSKNQLTKLIDFLALYDLAAELRQIVETKILKKIYSLLTEEEKQFLKTTMGHKDPFELGKLGLEKWDGSEQTLRLLLHKRGLARLGAALSGQDPDFVWYICHLLDIGRGTALYKLYSKQPIHGVTDTILSQIKELL